VRRCLLEPVRLLVSSVRAAWRHMSDPRPAELIYTEH